MAEGHHEPIPHAKMPVQICTPGGRMFDARLAFRVKLRIGPAPLRAKVSYWYDRTYGLTVGYFTTYGSGDTGLYALAPVSGSASGSLNSNGFVFTATASSSSSTGCLFSGTRSAFGRGSTASSRCNIRSTQSSTAVGRTTTASGETRRTTTPSSSRHGSPCDDCPPRAEGNVGFGSSGEKPCSAVLRSL
jgi:hypothetical protein